MANVQNQLLDRNTQGGMLRISSDSQYHDYTVFESTLKKTCPPARKKHAIPRRLSRLFQQSIPFFATQQIPSNLMQRERVCWLVVPTGVAAPRDDIITLSAL